MVSLCYIYMVSLCYTYMVSSYVIRRLSNGELVLYIYGELLCNSQVVTW